MFIALIFLVITVFFVGNGQKGVPVRAEATSEDLLPVITNCTVQTGIPYENDSNPYHVMDVYLPVGKGPFPAFIYIHGGGWHTGSRDEYNVTGPFYAERGIAGFSIDYTLTTDNKTSWPQDIQDVISAIRYVRENAKLYGINPAEIAVMGDSAGGQLAALAGVLQGNESFLAEAGGNPKVSSRVCLVVDYYGPTDLQFIGENLQMSSVYSITTNFLGNVTYGMNPNLWIQASPATYISSDDPFFFIVHGTNDTVVPIEVSDDFNAKLQAAGVETYFLPVENGDHSILTNEKENLIVLNSLEPVLKRIFNLDQQNVPEFSAPIIFPLILILILITSSFFPVRHTKNIHGRLARWYEKC